MYISQINGKTTFISNVYLAKKKSFFSSSSAQGGGIGTLIIFIAIVLVAAIAAYVLMGTGGSLQQRALLVGKETTAKVSTQLDVMSVYGHAFEKPVYLGYQQIDELILTIRISPGGQPIDVNKMLMQYATGDIFISPITINKTYENSTGGLDNNNHSDYYVKHLSGNGDLLLENEETYEVHFVIEDGKFRQPVKNGTKFTISLRPAQGTESVIEGKVPTFIPSQYLRLYP